MSVATLVPTDLSYFQSTFDGTKPWVDTALVVKDNYERAKNFTVKSYPADVENVRGKEGQSVHSFPLPSSSEFPILIHGKDQYELDKSGFEFHKAPSTLTADDFDNEEKIKSVYYQEVIDTIKKFTGASKVVIFDHSKPLPPTPNSTTHNNPALRNNDPNTPTGPAGSAPRRRTAEQVHVDQTPKAASIRVTRHLPADEASKRIKGRYQIINLWRPIRHEAYDRPLAVCDFTSVDFKNDLVPTDLKYPEYIGETFNVRQNPNHKWKYLKGMTPEEVILIKW